ncbi:uncharacterized protein LOC135950592 [Calliphora vicina]|uniref:uncharacterized protein LOC135950592 n=1 Tax=Calliphora vicina TaxID=7373 RepID=UPI00325B50F6
MAVLPPERTTFSRPFDNTGVDFAGPFDIKTYADRGCKVTKGYVMVFVCFETKAIHLEATSEISTQAFLAAFINTRLLSLNGILFRQCATYGGLWEAEVKSFKMHLKRISHSQSFTYEEFSTLLARIESCLNSRPLSPSSEDPAYLCALTPGHFLIGSPLLSPPEPNLTDHSLSYVNRWQKLKVLHHHFAQRWKEEYLEELHKRFKWKYLQRDYAIGDVVIIRKDNLPPNGALAALKKLFAVKITELESPKYELPMASLLGLSYYNVQSTPSKSLTIGGKTQNSQSRIL